MNTNLQLASPASIAPIPKVEISIRPGTMADIDWMDLLQKKHSKQLGFFPRKQFEGYLEMDGVLVAECNGTPIGYVLYKDRYSGRDDLGAVFQVVVEDEYRRHCVAAALVKEVFERAAYGCRLFCCWCAQDLPANYFWEGLGFVPIAFRTGSRKKGKGGEPRMHILWQRRVRADDDHPYWYPHQTRGGSIREERLVFPIPPGTRWSDAKPVVLPEEARKPKELIEQERLQLEASREEKKRLRREKAAAKPAEAEAETVRIFVDGKFKTIPKPVHRGSQASPGARAFGSFQGPDSDQRRPLEESSGTPTEKKLPRPMLKHEKAAVAFCRELRDRWQERVAEEPAMLEAGGKYDVARLPPQGSQAARALPLQTARALPRAA